MLLFQNSKSMFCSFYFYAHDTPHLNPCHTPSFMCRQYVAANLCCRYPIDVMGAYLFEPSRDSIITSLSGWTKKASDRRTILCFLSSSGISTLCLVDISLSAVHRCMRSPILTSTVPGMGLAGVYVPFTGRTSNPPTLSWNNNVMLP